MSVLHREDAKIKRLRAIELFSTADKKALEHLASAADEVSFDAGDVLIREGQHHREGYLIVSGRVDVEVGGETVATVHEGEIIGELALFVNDPVASATVVAAEGVSALTIPYNRFDQILDENPQLTKAIARQLAKRLRSMDLLYQER